MKEGALPAPDLIFPMKPFKDKDLQLFIGTLLQAGVIVAMLIVVSGLLLYLGQEGKGNIHYTTFQAAEEFSFSAFFSKLGKGDSYAIIELGVMLLILTPIARVFFAMLAFFLERDWLYVLISFLVLGIIAASMFLGYKA